MSIMSQLKNEEKKTCIHSLYTSAESLQNFKNSKYGVLHKVRYDTAGDLDYYMT